MITDIFNDSLLSDVDPVKKAKKKFATFLRQEWKKAYKITYDEALDLATIWAATATDDREKLCKKMNIHRAVKLNGFLKQFKKTKSLKKTQKWSPTEILDLASKLDEMPHENQLIMLWQLPNRTGLNLELGLDPTKTSLSQTLLSIMQRRNLGDLSSLTNV